MRRVHYLSQHRRSVLERRAQEMADARRDRALGRAGYRVLRLAAEVVLREPERAAGAVRAALVPSAWG